MNESLILWVIGGYVLALAIGVVIIRYRPECPICHGNPCGCWSGEDLT